LTDQGELQRPALNFVLMMAALFSTIALSIDAMLPALPEIAASLSPDAPNRAQIVVTSFVLGMGIGTLFAGPLSDAYGRKPAIIAGLGLYALGALGCYFANDLNSLLAARVIQGLGAAAPRVVGSAMIRDLYKGRAMAQVLSLIMTIFTLMPAIAPLIGQGIIAWGGWHIILVFFIAFAALNLVWVGLFQPETLPPTQRRSLNLRKLVQGLREVLAQRIVLVSTAVQSLVLGGLFGTLSSLQGIFEQRFDRADSFPLWFGLIALLSSMGAFANARLVQRLGMRRMVAGALWGMFAASALLAGDGALHLLPAPLDFALLLAWAVMIFAAMGLTLGNLSAMALEPLGHLAGMASSAVTALSTVAAVVLAMPLGLAFNGTALPLALGVCGFAAAALGVLRLMQVHD
jgi:DHA1 family bicyclomycin/chloramphenicol resistance-like MFS transporter